MYKRIYAFISLLCILFCLSSATVSAAQQKNIQLGTAGISDGDCVYFGSGELAWRVLDADKTSTNSNGIFLITKYLQGSGSQYGDVYFNKVKSSGNTWKNSDAQSWCTSFLENSFSDAEKNAISQTYKYDSSYTTKETNFANAVNFSSCSLSGDKVFFLSAEEAEKYFSDEADRGARYKGKSMPWWLRSPVRNKSQYAGNIGDYGWIMAISVDHNYNGSTLSARPALNLSSSSVLFSSSPNGKKSSVTGLYEPESGEINEWKLTVTDSSRDFNASLDSSQSASVNPGDSIKINYSGASADADEFVSAIITDIFGNMVRYGHIAASSQSGTAEVTIPSDLAESSYILKVFSEKCRGGKETDYASALCEIPITVGKAHPPCIWGTVSSYSTSHFITVYTFGIPSGAKIIAAGYKNNSLSQVSDPIEMKTTPQIMMLNGDFDTIKLMAWEDLIGMHPYAAAAEPVPEK